MRRLTLAPLPAAASSLLDEVSAPPRLVAHLTLVHDVALKLLAHLRREWPALPIDADAVAFGAATHDLGKALHPSELSVPGTLHEAAGEALMLARGVAPSRCRFARTHGADLAADGATLALEDLLVIAADTVWKGKRSAALDDALGRALASRTAVPPWEAFMALDGWFTTLAEDADARLAHQAIFSLTAAQKGASGG